MHPFRISAALLFLPILFGCGHREIMEPYPANNTSNVNLAGNWALRGDKAAIARQLNKAIRDTDGARDGVHVAPQARDRRGRTGSRAGRINAGLVYVFFKNGDSLKITQTPSALFISFDRAIVEEYRFGEMRNINVGQAEAQRVSGWDGSDYVIGTLDRNGMKLSERYSLSADRKTLTRQIIFRGKNKESVSVVQAFIRVD